MKKYLLFVFLLTVFVSLKGQNDSFPTIGEVFNFEVGDTFQYENVTGNFTYPYFTYTYYTNIITSKQVFSDSVLYWFNGSTTYHTTYKNLDSIVLKLVGEDTITHYDIGWTHIDTFYLSTNYDTSLFAEHWVMLPVSSSTQTAWCVGLGLVSTAYAESGNASANWAERLVYFHKTNGKKWGEYHKPVGVDDLQGDLAITVYPNPVADHFQIHTEYPATFTLYNTLGQQMLSQKVDKVSTISRNGLQPGIYYWIAEDAGQKLSTGKLILR